MHKEISLECVAANSTSKLFPRNAWKAIAVDKLSKHLTTYALYGEISVQPACNQVVADCCCHIKRCHAEEDRKPGYADYEICWKGVKPHEKINIRAGIGIK